MEPGPNTENEAEPNILPSGPGTVPGQERPGPNPVFSDREPDPARYRSAAEPGGGGGGSPADPPALTTKEEVSNHSGVQEKPGPDSPGRRLPSELVLWTPEVSVSSEPAERHRRLLSFHILSIKRCPLSAAPPPAASHHPPLLTQTSPVYSPSPSETQSRCLPQVPPAGNSHCSFCHHHPEEVFILLLYSGGISLLHEPHCQLHGQDVTLCLSGRRPQHPRIQRGSCSDIIINCSGNFLLSGQRHSTASCCCGALHRSSGHTPPRCRCPRRCCLLFVSR